jgi:hypothetical protein
VDKALVAAARRYFLRSELVAADEAL